MQVLWSSFSFSTYPSLSSSASHFVIWMWLALLKTFNVIYQNFRMQSHEGAEDIKNVATRMFVPIFCHTQVRKLTTSRATLTSQAGSSWPLDLLLAPAHQEVATQPPLFLHISFGQESGLFQWGLFLGICWIQTSLLLVASLAKTFTCWVKC